MTIKILDIKNLGQIVIRPMLLTDVSSVHNVESKAYNFPWSAKLIHDCIVVGYLCWMIEYEGKAIAYAIYRLVDGEAHLFNIAVDPDYQNKGIAKSFLTFLLEQMKDNDGKNVILEVRVSNKIARKIYKDFGFKEIGIRKGYYPDGDNQREDGINLELKFS